MGFFTIVAWAVLCVFFTVIIMMLVEHHNDEFRPEFFWAVILSLCWLGWRYFGA